MISVAITTRNRPEYLRLALVHFLHYSTQVNNIIIIDDNSDCKEENEKIIQEFKYAFSFTKCINLHYHYNNVRLGIAKSKNRCLNKMIELDTENFFLFDDDCFPKRIGWEACFIDASTDSNVHHLMFLTPFSIIQPVKQIGTITAYNNCAGVMLYVDRKVVEAVGGYDVRFGMYGYEHAQYSQRIYKAKLTGAYPYNTPNDANSYIYSLDISFGWNKEIPPFPEAEQKLYSSVTKQEASLANENAYLMTDAPIFQALENL
jgi:glycosyltransferase involved in cell wall biosynthesis